MYLDVDISNEVITQVVTDIHLFNLSILNTSITTLSGSQENIHSTQNTQLTLLTQPVCSISND